jgi:hypothetical protein
MPTARLTFRLPEEDEEFRTACEGSAAKALLWDIDQACRSVLKYEAEPHEERCKLAEQIRYIIASAEGVTLE